MAYPSTASKETTRRPETYDHEHFGIRFPDDYSVHEPADSDSVHVIRGDRGRIEIFSKSDFANRIHGYSSSGLEEFEHKLVPKQKRVVGGYELWLFHHEDDEETKAAVLAIADSFELREKQD